MIFYSSLLGFQLLSQFQHFQPFKIRVFPSGYYFKQTNKQANKFLLSIFIFSYSSFKAFTHKFKYKSSVMFSLISSDNRIFLPSLLTWPAILWSHITSVHMSSFCVYHCTMGKQILPIAFVLV